MLVAIHEQKVYIFNEEVQSSDGAFVRWTKILMVF